MKDADVYINGAYAGKAKDLKSLWLRPESYEIQVRATGYETFATRIYLLRGKTMEVKGDWSGFRMRSRSLSPDPHLIA